MNKKYLSIFTLLRRSNIFLPCSRHNMLNVMLQATNTTAKRVSVILNDKSLSDYQKQVSLESLTFQTKNSSTELKYALSSKSDDYITKLTDAMSTSNPYARDPLFITGSSANTVTPRVPPVNRRVFLCKLHDTINMMESVGHSLPLAILYYTSVTIQGIIARDADALLGVDVSIHDLVERATSHSGDTFRTNKDYGYTFKLVDFINKIANSCVSAIEMAAIAHRLEEIRKASQIEINRIATLSLPEAEKKKLTKSSLFKLSQSYHLSDSDFPSRALDQTFLLPNSEDRILLAHIIGAYLEKIGVLEILGPTQAVRNRKNIKAIWPTFYKEYKDFTLNERLKNKAENTASVEAFFAAFPAIKEAFDSSKIPVTFDALNYVDFYAPKLARISPAAFSALYLGVDSKVNLPMLVPPVDWISSNRDLPDGFSISRGGYLSNRDSGLHRGVHGQSNFSYAHASPNALLALNLVQQNEYYIAPRLVRHIEANFQSELVSLLKEYLPDATLLELLGSQQGVCNVCSLDSFIHLDDPLYTKTATLTPEQLVQYHRSTKTFKYMNTVNKRHAIYLKFLNLFLDFTSTFVYARLFMGLKIWFTWFYDLRFRIYSTGWPLNPMGNPFNKFFIDKHPCSRPVVKTKADVSFLNQLILSPTARLCAKRKERLASLRAELGVLTTSEADASASGISIISLLTGDLDGCISTNIFYRVADGLPLKKKDAYQELVTSMQAEAPAYFTVAYQHYRDNFLEHKKTLDGSISLDTAYFSYHLALQFVDRAHIKGMAMKCAYNQQHVTRVSDLLIDFVALYSEATCELAARRFGVGAVCSLFFERFSSKFPDLVVLLNLVKERFSDRFTTLNDESDLSLEERPILERSLVDFKDARNKTTVIFATGPSTTHTHAFISVAALGVKKFRYQSSAHRVSELVYQIPRTMADVRKVELSTFPNFVHYLDALVLNTVVLSSHQVRLPRALHDAIRLFFVDLCLKPHCAHDAFREWILNIPLLKQFYFEALLKHVLEADSLAYFLQINHIVLTPAQQKDFKRWENQRKKLLAAYHAGEIDFSPFILK